MTLARGEAECEIMKKTFYKVGYDMVWLLMYFQIFFKTGSASFSQKNWFQFLPKPQFNFNEFKENR